MRELAKPFIPEGGGGGGPPRIFWWGGQGGGGGGGGGVSLEFLVGVCSWVLQILTRFQTKKCNFPHRYQTRPLKSIPVFRPGF